MRCKSLRRRIRRALGGEGDPAGLEDRLRQLRAEAGLHDAARGRRRRQPQPQPQPAPGTVEAAWERAVERAKRRVLRRLQGLWERWPGPGLEPPEERPEELLERAGRPVQPAVQPRRPDRRAHVLETVVSASDGYYRHAIGARRRAEVTSRRRLAIRLDFGNREDRQAAVAALAPPAAHQAQPQPQPQPAAPEEAPPPTVGALLDALAAARLPPAAAAQEAGQLADGEYWIRRPAALREWAARQARVRRLARLLRRGGLIALWTAARWRLRQRLDGHLRRRAFQDAQVWQLTRGDPESTVVLGAALGYKGFGYGSAPMRRLARRLRQDPAGLIIVHEHYTSQACSRCVFGYARPAKLYEPGQPQGAPARRTTAARLECRACSPRPDDGRPRHRRWNRDVNAARNIRFKAWYMFNTGGLLPPPLYHAQAFSRGQGTLRVLRCGEALAQEAGAGAAAA